MSLLSSTSGLALVFKRVTMLAAGTAVGQIIQIAAQPVLGRIYPAADFGYLGQMTSVATLLAAACTLQLHSALVVPRDWRDGEGVLSAGMAASSVLVVLCTVGLWLLRNEVFGGSTGESIPFATGVLLLALSHSAFVRGWQTRVGSFRVLSALGLFRAVTVVGVQVGLGWAGIKQGLIVGAVAGECALVVAALVTGRMPTITRLMADFAPRKVWRRLVEYYDFAFVGTIQEVFSVAVLTAPVYLFARQYSAEVGGQFAMAHRLVWAPVTLLGAALAQSVLHEFAGQSASEIGKSRLLRMGWHMATGATIGVAVALAAPSVVKVALSARWDQAGSMSRSIAVWAAAFFAAVPFRVGLRVLRLQRLQLIVDVCVGGLILTAFACAAALTAEAMTRIVAALGVFQNVLLVWACRRGIRESAPAAEPAL